MALFSNRKREREIAELEASGQDLWTDGFEPRALTRLDEVWQIAEDARQYDWQRFRDAVTRRLRFEGGHPIQFTVAPGFFSANPNMDPELRLDLLQAVVEEYDPEVEGVEYAVNRILDEHRISYRLVEGTVVERSSDELFTSVVEPALQLLVGSDYTAAHDCYLKALKELTSHDAGDAITDAGTALQETLTALGCSGNALGSLIADAKSRGLLGPQDSPLTTGIVKFADWVSAERSTTGDAHHHSDAEVADAWLMVHVVGALIVRLVDPNSKGRGA